MNVQRASDKLAMPQWNDHIWWSNDGVRLHTRVYSAIKDCGKLPILCMPGLTRNARDFDVLAPRLAVDRTVYAIDIRGRGMSGYAKDVMSYAPLTYLQDVAALLDELAIERFISIGTSLGGLVTMLIAATQPGRLAGVVLNDVGPEIDPVGLERIKGYVGQKANFPTWVHTARSIALTNATVYPDWELEDWLVLAKRTHRLTPEGRIVPDYDANIAGPLKLPGGEAGVDLWPAFDALKTVPTLVLRGGLSDILSAQTANRMISRLDTAKLVTVPRVGHAPTLDEAVAVAAIEKLIASVA